MTVAASVIAAGVGGLPDLFAAGGVSPAQACAVYLDRLERFAVLGAWTTVDRSGALVSADASARRWAAGAPLSPIDGCPVGIKANIAVRGLPWHAGIGAYRGRVAAEDAACVARLRAAGAVILGLLNMDEGAFGATTDNPWYGRTDNPWRAGHTTGGSSGGSAAAVAAGLCAAALGTDTLGSVRIPSGLCGVFGHKPGRGLIATQGVVPLSPTLDHVGVLARSAADCGALLAVMAPDGRRPTSLDRRALAALRPQDIEGCEPAVAKAFERTVVAARSAGFTVDRLSLAAGEASVMRAAVLVLATEGSVAHEAALAGDLNGFSPTFRARLGLAAGKGFDEIAAAYRLLQDAADRTAAALQPYDGVLSPTMPRAAPATGDDMRDAGLFTAAANICGLPATAFPAGLDAAGLPLSVQVMAHDEATALAIAAILATTIGQPPGWE